MTHLILEMVSIFLFVFCLFSRVYFLFLQQLIVHSIPHFLSWKIPRQHGSVFKTSFSPSERTMHTALKTSRRGRVGGPLWFLCPPWRGYFKEAGDIGPVEIGPDEIGPANRTGRNRTLRNRPTFKIFLKRSYFSVKVGLFLPIISKFHKVLWNIFKKYSTYSTWARRWNIQRWIRHRLYSLP